MPKAPPRPGTRVEGGGVAEGAQSGRTSPEVQHHTRLCEVASVSQQVKGVGGWQDPSHQDFLSSLSLHLWITPQGTGRAPSLFKESLRCGGSGRGRHKDFVS